MVLSSGSRQVVALSEYDCLRRVDPPQIESCQRTFHPPLTGTFNPSLTQVVDMRSLTLTPECTYDELEEDRNKMEDEVRNQEVKRKTAP